MFENSFLQDVRHNLREILPPKTTKCSSGMHEAYPGVAIAFNGFAYAQTRYTFVLMPIAALLVAVEMGE